MIEHAFTMTTDLFEVSTPQPHFINERCFGEDCAHWLRTALDERGIASRDPIQEDWGWVLLASLNGWRFTITIGVLDESIGVVPAEWRIGVAYERPVNGIRAWIRAVPTADLHSLADIVKAILKAEPRFHSVDDA